MCLNRPDRWDMEYISSAEQSMPLLLPEIPTLRSQLSDLRTSYCQRFISALANWHFICIPASLQIEHLGKTMTGSLPVVTSHIGPSLMLLTGLLPIEDPHPFVLLLPSPSNNQTLPSLVRKGALDVCDTHLSISRPLPVLTYSNLKDRVPSVTN